MQVKELFSTLTSCHKEVLKKLQNLGKIANVIAKRGGKDLPEQKKNLEEFFHFAETSLFLHTRDEEQGLFPILGPKLCTHACGAGSMTPVEVMMQNHKDVHGAIFAIKTLLKLTEKEKDFSQPISKEITRLMNFITATMRDHIWKEDNVLYQLAEESLSEDEKEAVLRKMNSFRKESNIVCTH